MNKYLLSLFLAVAYLVPVLAKAQLSKLDTAKFGSGNSTFPIVLNDWKVKVGDDTAWAAKELDDSEWRVFNQKNKSSDVDTLLSYGFKNRIWFRKQLYFDSISFQFPYALKIEQTGAMEVYIDGIKRDTYGVIGSTGNDRYEHQKTPLFFNISNPGLHTIALRFSDSNLNNQSNDLDKTVSVQLYTAVGTYNTMRDTLLISSSLVLVSSAFFFALFMVHILMFLFFKKDRSNLYFSVFCMGMATIWLCFYLMINKNLIGTNDQVVRTLGVSAFVTFIALSTFINKVFAKFGWRYRILVGLGVSALILSFIFSENDILNAVVPIIFFFVVFLEAIILIIRAIIRKIPGVRILGAGILFFIFSILGIMAYSLWNKGIVIAPGDNIAQVSAVVIFVLIVYSIPVSLSAYLAWKVASTNRMLEAQIVRVEHLSQEKQSILENQNQLLEEQVNLRTSELNKEKKKSDDLLLNILPEEIAEELKQNGYSKAQNHEEVSVLFTDFVNFTQTSEKLGVDELLDELNISFTAFDHIMERHGMEKIKTIGDAYLAVSGLPKANEQHAENAVLAALEIIDFVEKRKTEVSYGLDIRIGINSGPLIAGIIGIKKFAYDIWGDTVNIAARMEQTGEAGKVNISENTYNLVRGSFDCEYRGKIAAKNKGEMDMYFCKIKNQ